MAGPLLLLILLLIFGYVAMAMWIARRLARIPQVFLFKAIVFLATIGIFALLPVIDHIIGYYYWRHLCATESGIRVNKVVELGPEYWKEDGTSKFITPDGFIDEKALVPRFKFRYGSRDISALNIRGTINLIFDAADGSLLGTYTYFIYFGGWLASIDTVQQGERCPKDTALALIPAILRPLTL